MTAAVSDIGVCAWTPRTAVRRWRSAAWRGYDDVLGMNARNQHIAATNPCAAIRLVADKAATKQVLRRHGVPVPCTLGLIDSRSWAHRLSSAALPARWVMKPNRGRGGNGILIAHGRDPESASEGWRRVSGSPLSVAEVRDHLRLLLDGDFSGGVPDAAMIEPVVHAHPEVASLSYRGLPDIRVICVDDEPRVAMLRLPTRRSEGCANLHRGAVGAGVDIESGRVVSARVGRREVARHPDTGRPLVGVRIPFWADVLRVAAACAPATGLRYAGADVVVADQGPLVLEVNARPGLQIQNVTAVGMRALGMASS